MREGRRERVVRKEMKARGRRGGKEERRMGK